MRKLILLLLLISLSGCAESEAARGAPDYDETKKMVVDILKTDEGKKALQEIMADQEMQQKLVLDQAIVTTTIENTLTSEKGKEFWKKSFEDPKFAESFAESMKNAHEALLKNLMNDPEYREKMIEIMKDPQLSSEFTNLLKSKEYREHLKEVITETFENPIYQAKLQELMIKATEELKSKEKEDEKKSEE